MQQRFLRALLSSRTLLKYKPMLSKKCRGMRGSRDYPRSQALLFGNWYNCIALDFRSSHQNWWNRDCWKIIKTEGRSELSFATSSQFTSAIVTSQQSLLPLGSSHRRVLNLQLDIWLPLCLADDAPGYCCMSLTEGMLWGCRNYWVQSEYSGRDWSNG